MEIPKVLVLLIADFGVGCVIECWKCDKQDHVDNLETACEDTDEWTERYRFNVEIPGHLCRACWNERVCTICYGISDESNYSCESCGNMVCFECDDNLSHFDAHGPDMNQIRRD